MFKNLVLFQSQHSKLAFLTVNDCSVIGVLIQDALINHPGLIVHDFFYCVFNSEINVYA